LKQSYIYIYSYGVSTGCRALLHVNLHGICSHGHCTKRDRFPPTPNASSRTLCTQEAALPCSGSKRWGRSRHSFSSRQVGAPTHSNTQHVTTKNKHLSQVTFPRTAANHPEFVRGLRLLLRGLVVEVGRPIEHSIFYWASTV
jgi:hypothetical protein